MSLKENFVRDLDSNIYKLLDSYRLLLRINTVDSSTSIHEEHQLSVLSANIVLHSQSLLNQIDALRKQIVVHRDDEDSQNDVIK